MIKQIKNSQPSDMLRIEYMPGNLCNHRCNYCFPGSFEGDKKWPMIETAKENLSHLLRHYEQHGKTRSTIFFVGGEPTLWKGLAEVCNHLKASFDTIIEMSSNGSRKVSWWRENAKNFDHVGISVHHEFANLDHIIEVCDTLYEQGTFVNADVLIDPSAFDKCTANVEYLKRSKYNWPILAKVVNFNGVHRYSGKQLEYFDESVKRMPDREWYLKKYKKPGTFVEITKEDNSIITTDNDSWLIRNDLNHFLGWECNIGVDFIKIYADGSVSSNCQQTLYGVDKVYNLYDNNFINEFKPDIAPVTCTKLVCECNEETVCNKRKKNV